jgi:hypothetical protein
VHSFFGNERKFLPELVQSPNRKNHVNNVLAQLYEEPLKNQASMWPLAPHFGDEGWCFFGFVSALVGMGGGMLDPFKLADWIK